MHKEILSENQLELLPLLKQFIREYYLFGGTAIALHIGHRRSIVFDLFKNTAIKHKNILKRITATSFPYSVTRRVSEQMNINVHNVKLTFFEYTFKIAAKCKFEDSIRLPELIDLAAMKAYALGHRSKWKDYIDLYYILKSYFTVEQISERAIKIYDQLFSEKLFRAQLSYFKDIDFTEEIDYIATPVSEGEIMNFLIDKETDFTI